MSKGYKRTYRRGANKFVTDGGGFVNMLTNQNVINECNRIAQNVASRCGEGYIVEPTNGQTRKGARVWTDTAEAYYDNLENDTMIKNLY